MKDGVVFVLSDVRSGSTLLDQCLGSHSQVASLGEVHWLRAYALQDRRIYDPQHPLQCSCGEPVPECTFWSAVRIELRRPLETLRLHVKLMEPGDLIRHPPLKGRLLQQVLRAAPWAFRHSIVRRLYGGPDLARDSIQLFNAVRTVSGKRYCVDSSKSALRFRAVFEAQPGHTKAVVLSRDYRAVVHSKMKRGAKLEAAARGWRNKMRQIDVITKDLPRDGVHFLSYEALCTRPREELGTICRFLGIDFEQSMLERPATGVHHIGGSPSKFDSGRARIALDAGFLDGFDDGQLEQMRSIVGDQATRWGY